MSVTNPPPPDLRCVLHVATWWMDLTVSSGAVWLSGRYGTWNGKVVMWGLLPWGFPRDLGSATWIELSRSRWANFSLSMCSPTWPNIDFKSLRITLNYQKRTFIMVLQRCTLAVVMNEYKLGTLKDGWNIYWRCAMLIGRNWRHWAYLVPPDAEAGNWEHCWQ